MTEPERVQKLIAAAGLCSRREAEKWIEEERVEVNGQLVKIGASATRKDKITVNGVPIKWPKLVYYVLNKPKNVLTTSIDYKGGHTVVDLVPVDERIFPVGRLDKDTTGLIMLTNDGEFANRMMHPRYEVQKTYVATLDKPFQGIHSVNITKGVHFKEGVARAQIKIISPRKVQATLHQGYNHIVKRLFASQGYRVVDLTRTKIGPLKVDIPLGAFRELSQKEVETLLAEAKPKPRPPQDRPRRRTYSRAPNREEKRDLRERPKPFSGGGGYQSLQNNNRKRT